MFPLCLYRLQSYSFPCKQLFKHDTEYKDGYEPEYLLPGRVAQWF